MYDDDPSLNPLINKIVCQTINRIAQTALIALQRARDGGAEYLKPEQYNRYIEAMSALDRLHRAVKK